MIAAGNLGLVSALKRYDVTHCKKATFQTYAFYWIYQSINKYGQQHQQNIRIPYNVKSEYKIKCFSLDEEFDDKMVIQIQYDENYMDDILKEDQKESVHFNLSQILNQREYDIIREYFGLECD